MVSQENKLGLYIAVPLYFGLLFGAVYWAYRRKKRMEQDGKTDFLSAHYLGGRSFGPILTAGSLFAELFSGYTVTGIPNAAYATGWIILEWMPTFVGIVFGMVGTGFRLKKAGSFRNHSTPVDFITDRFQSQILRYIIVTIQSLGSIMYLAVQVSSMKATFNSMFNIDPNANLPTILIMILILLFESIGGLSSVTITDVIQGLIMSFGFIVLPIIMKIHYGGWAALDPTTYPKPEFYQTPSKDSQWQFWQFSLINISFFTLPHIMQRLYASRDIKSLKFAYNVMTISPWFAYISGIFIGTVGVTLLVDQDGAPMMTSDAFIDILDKVMSLGGFAEFVSVIAVTGSLAAVMSTANSLVIAISQLITVEVIRPLVSACYGNQSNYRLVWYGRAVSLVSIVVALCIGLIWKAGIQSMSALQFPISVQALPAFLFGLFSKTDIHPWSISAGASIGTFYVFGIYFGYLKSNQNALPIDAGVTGVCLNTFIIVVFEGLTRMIRRKNNRLNAAASKNYLTTTDLLYPDRPAWDIPNVQERFGKTSLSPQLLWKSMEGVKEPMTEWTWVLLMLITLSFVTPLTAALQPPLNDNGWVSLPPVVNGLPWWVFKIILMSTVPYAILFISIYQLPSEFPPNAALEPPVRVTNLGSGGSDNVVTPDEQPSREEDEAEGTNDAEKGSLLQ